MAQIDASWQRLVLGQQAAFRIELGRSLLVGRVRAAEAKRSETCSSRSSPSEGLCLRARPLAAIALRTLANWPSPSLSKKINQHGPIAFLVQLGGFSLKFRSCAHVVFHANFVEGQFMKKTFCPKNRELARSILIRHRSESGCPSFGSTPVASALAFSWLGRCPWAKCKKKKGASRMKCGSCFSEC